MKNLVEGYALKARNEAGQISAVRPWQSSLGLHVYDEDCHVHSHAKEDKPAERLIWRQSEVEEEEGKFYGEVNEVVVYLFDEENLKNLKQLRRVDHSYMSLRSSSDCVGYALSNFVLTVRILREETDVGLPADHSSLPQRKAQCCHPFPRH